jgi:glucose/arabinose dehydrogenase
VNRRVIALGAVAALIAACSAVGPPQTTHGEAAGTTIETTTSSPTSSPPRTTSTTRPRRTTTTRPPTTTTLPQLKGLRLQEIASGLSQPTYATSPVGDRRLFVTERTGVIRVVGPDGLVTEPFLDIRDRVASGGIEQGLLGLAFHPRFKENGRLFVYYVHTSGNRRLAEYRAQGGRADPGSERLLIDLAQPEDSTDIRHYGGMVLFGPDGNLWVSLGDGANASAQGQDPGTLFATISRLDVDDRHAQGKEYSIPADNPFVDGGGAPEVWAYGLRNPWRFTIDAKSLIVADVGLEQREEVDVLPLRRGGWNLGWPIVEGTACFAENPCDPSEFVVPVVEYDHEQGCAITGGHVYRGRAIPEIRGHYFFGDWCTGFVRSFRLAGGEAVDQRDWTEQLGPVVGINAFGIDSAGELYLVSHDGLVRKLVPVR